MLLKFIFGIGQHLMFCKALRVKLIDHDKKFDHRSSDTFYDNA